MRAPLSCESIVFLVFMRLLLLMGLSGIAVCSTVCLTICDVGESLGLYFSHLVSSLGWVFLGCGPLFLSIRPYLFSPLVRRLTSTLVMPLHCSCHDIV